MNLRDPAVLIPIATFVLGFGVNAARAWLKARAHRKVVAAELAYEMAKRTPDLSDDAAAELQLRLMQADEAALAAVVDKADSSVIAALLKGALRR